MRITIQICGCATMVKKYLQIGLTMVKKTVKTGPMKMFQMIKQVMVMVTVMATAVAMAVAMETQVLLVMTMKMIQIMSQKCGCVTMVKRYLQIGSTMEWKTVKTDPMKMIQEWFAMTWIAILSMKLMKIKKIVNMLD